MIVRDAMLPDPVTTTPDESFGSLVQRLTSRRQATSVVLDGDRVVGLVGIHDILRKIVPHYVDLDEKLAEVMHGSYFEEHLERIKNTRVRDFMSTEFDPVAPDDALIKAVVLIVEKKRNTLPVVEKGRYVGVVTRRNILEHVVARWVQAEPPTDA